MAALPGDGFLDEAALTADNKFTYTVAGAFRIDWRGCNVSTLEVVHAPITRRHTPSVTGSLDYSNIFPVGTELTFEITIADPVPAGVVPYFKLRDL